MNEEFQKGNESKLSSTERLFLHQEWLKQQHIDIKNMIQSKVIVEDKPIQGFVKD